MSMRMFEVEQIGKYAISVEAVENIEDASNSAVTEEELQEMMGSRASQGIHLNMALIKSEVENLQCQAISAGKVSVLCKDEELINIMVTRFIPSSDLVPYSRRVGNRFFFRTEESVKAAQAKKPKVIKDKHFKWILNATLSIMNKNLTGSAVVEFKYAYADKEGMLKLCAHITTLDAVKKELVDVESEDLELVEQLWNNPSYFDTVKI